MLTRIGETLQPTLEDVIALRDEMLRPEMKRRGLTRNPPSYLGFDDIDQWDDDALLTLACLAFDEVVVRRQRSLLARTKTYANIDGLVRLNVKNFLTALQRKQDPVGWATFQNLRRAAEAWIRAERILRAEGSGPVKADEALDPVRGEDAPEPLAARDAWARVDCTPAIEGDLRRLAIDGRDGVEGGEGILGALVDADLGRFTVSEVKREVVDDVRRCHEQQCYEGDGTTAIGEASEPVVLVDTFRAVEDHFEWRALVWRVDHALASQSEARRDAMRQVFWAIVDVCETKGPESVRQAELGRELGIARSTLSDYVRSIGELTREITRKDP
ncbi:MAG: hypothetical protein RIT81_20790 [Deltaproteobacteria bacterium]